MSVSLIIAAFNAAPYIERALASVEQQTRPPDEVIVIDDGSTDETGGRAEAFASRSALNVITLRQSNKGLAATRNVGIQQARGELIGFLDADDVIYPEFMERTLHGIERHPDWAACFTDRDVVDARGQVMAKDLDHPAFKRIQSRDVGDGFRELCDPGLFCKIVPGNPIPMTIIVRREAIDSIDGFDEALRFAEDRFFLLKMVKRGWKFGFVDRPLGTWQRHDTNLTSSHNGSRNSPYIDLLLAKLLHNRADLSLRPEEIRCIEDARKQHALSWLYTTSSNGTQGTLTLAARLLRERRVPPMAFAKAIARLALGKRRESCAPRP